MQIKSRPEDGSIAVDEATIRQRLYDCGFELRSENEDLKGQLHKSQELFKQLYEHELKQRTELYAVKHRQEVLIDENCRQGQALAEMSEQLSKQHKILCRLAEANDEPVVYAVTPGCQLLEQALSSSWDGTHGPVLFTSHGQPTKADLKEMDLKDTLCATMRQDLEQMVTALVEDPRCQGPLMSVQYNTVDRVDGQLYKLTLTRLGRDQDE